MQFPFESCSKKLQIETNSRGRKAACHAPLTNLKAALETVAPELGFVAEFLRRWVRQAQFDVGRRESLTTSE